jgi:hypothetical protein
VVRVQRWLPIVLFSVSTQIPTDSTRWSAYLLRTTWPIDYAMPARILGPSGQGASKIQGGQGYSPQVSHYSSQDRLEALIID